MGKSSISINHRKLLISHNQRLFFQCLAVSGYDLFSRHARISMAGGRLFGAFLDGQDGAKALVSAPGGCECHGAGEWQWHWRSVARSEDGVGGWES